MSIPAEAENTLEEFTWAFGEDTVEEIEKRVHLVLENFQKMPLKAVRKILEHLPVLKGQL